MGYAHHPTGADDWTESADAPIARDEGLGAAAASHHLEDHPDVGGTDLRAFRLVADPDGPSLYWNDDRVQVTGVDDASFPHLVEVAAALGAKVVGDDGEHYRPDGTSFEPDLDR